MDEENYLTLVPVDRASFTREMKNLPPSSRAVAEVAIQRILARQGLTLATGNWLRSLGSGLWEFRIGKSFKAVFSKSEIPSSLSS